MQHLVHSSSSVFTILHIITSATINNVAVSRITFSPSSASFSTSFSTDSCFSASLMSAAFPVADNDGVVLATVAMEVGVWSTISISRCMPSLVTLCLSTRWLSSVGR